MVTKTRAGSARQTFADEDVGNILLLEHVNLQVPDQALATLFYFVGMGFTRDPHMMVGLENMWANVGEQQLHLPTGKPNVLRGHVGVVTPSLDALAERLEAVAPRLAEGRFAWSRRADHLAVTCPWGNQFRCYEPDARFGAMLLGVPYVELSVPVGTAAGIASFYEEVMGAPAVLMGGAKSRAASVAVGQYQHLVFREAAEVPPYDGHHIAVYLARFSSSYAFLAERGLVTEEPLNHQYRFQEIVDPKTDARLFTLEHEVRGLRHAQFRRPLVNRTVGQYLEPRRVGNTTVLGSVR